jgi:DNA-binding MarR family transcriptional regulator
VTIDHAVRQIQIAFPQIYFACHTRHTRRRSSAYQLTARDGEILVHLATDPPLTLSELASHLDVAKSTLSAAIARLDVGGYVTRGDTGRGDRRERALVLTSKGHAAIAATSVLEAARLVAVLKRLPATDREAVAVGLRTLAAACRRPSRRGRS